MKAAAAIDSKLTLSVGDSSRLGFTWTGIIAQFEPLPDITAYELARLIPFFQGMALTEEKWGSLGTATRHLKRLS